MNLPLSLLYCFCLLIVNLTTPALILFDEEVPTDKTARNHYLQMEEHLQSYKEAFVDDDVWAVLSTKLSQILEIVNLLFFYSSAAD
ncbi:unnamed protein product [Acanthoscelides obtectus]|uniref:Timeless N-terminal domain-containing protein n=1 Tax=Acanthoscelides obtectus TaxID=200917 RepID=A0A9P0LR51_ACAOB|nr:unnamed protein product [Acanthoscelides obtectus]CAK1651322.1 Protein timeless homolog [Acanthoscelides obtectus]